MKEYDISVFYVDHDGDGENGTIIIIETDHALNFLICCSSQNNIPTHKQMNHFFDNVVYLIN